MDSRGDMRMGVRQMTWMMGAGALAVGFLLSLALVLGGCGKGRIYEGPPGAKAEAQPEPVAVPETKPVEPEPAKAPEPPPAAATVEPPPPPGPEVRETQLVDEEIKNLRREVEAGSAQVKAVPAEARPAAGAGTHFVQVGAFGSLETAKTLLNRLIDAGFKESRIKTGSTGDRRLYRVQAGAFPDSAAAKKALEKLKADYPAAFVTN
jgi:cell division protein FtsN